MDRQYRADSNVLETTFTTSSGILRVTEAVNSTLAGRLPWCELARRLEVISGTVSIKARLAFATRCETVSPWIQKNENGSIFHVGPVLGMIEMTTNLIVSQEDDRLIMVEGTLCAGQRGLLALVCGEAQPLGVPCTEDIDSRLDLSDEAWRTWVKGLNYQEAIS